MELLLDRATGGRALRDRVFLLDKTKGIYFFDQFLAVCPSGSEHRIQILSVGRPWSARQSRFSFLSPCNQTRERLWHGAQCKNKAGVHKSSDHNRKCKPTIRNQKDRSGHHERGSESFYYNRRVKLKFEHTPDHTRIDRKYQEFSHNCNHRRANVA